MLTKGFPALRKDRLKSKQPSTAKNAAVIYCRVSTDDQLQNYSIETQERQCQGYCEREGLEIVQVFTEAASAKTAARPRFQAMLAYCRKHNKTVGAVLVYAFNRFSRDQTDHLIVRRELTRQDIRLISVTEPFDGDTPEGKLQEGDSQQLRTIRQREKV